MQTLIVILVVLASALYAAARLLPGAWIERLLRAGEAFHPATGRWVRRFAARPRRAPGAEAQAGCSSCSAAAMHTPTGRRPLTKS